MGGSFLINFQAALGGIVTKGWCHLPAVDWDIISVRIPAKRVSCIETEVSVAVSRCKQTAVEKTIVLGMIAWILSERYDDL